VVEAPLEWSLLVWTLLGSFQIVELGSDIWNRLLRHPGRGKAS